MTTHETPDPVNRWATEHYGFEEDAPAPPLPGEPASPAAARRHQPTHAHRLGRRAALAAAGGVLGFAVIAGLGGIAAADVGDGSRGGGPAVRGANGVAGLFPVDGDGRGGDAGGGHR